MVIGFRAGVRFVPLICLIRSFDGPVYFFGTKSQGGMWDTMGGVVDIRRRADLPLWRLRTLFTEPSILSV